MKKIIYEGFIKERKNNLFVKSKNIFERINAINHGKKNSISLPVILSGGFLVTISFSRHNFIRILTSQESDLKIQHSEVIR